jgi:glycosyltransferase involved in cell wall biosynthesis
LRSFEATTRSANDMDQLKLHKDIDASPAREPTSADPMIILIAPNVGEQMGGEAMKALQILLAMRQVRPDTIQVTHERNRAELQDRLQLPNVHFVRDSSLARFMWRSVVLRGLIDYWFSKEAVRMAERIAGGRAAIIHQTEPNSPVKPRALSGKHTNVLGPINGNIYYPPAFRSHEKLSARLRRQFHMPMQAFNRLFVRGFTRTDLIFWAGGDRTRKSLIARGCVPARLYETLDCGIKEELLERPRVTHAGTNRRFVHFGRLVFHKGTALIIESLAKTRTPVTLDIIGRGPELARCRALALALNVGHRVTFMDWYESHAELLDSLRGYRALVLPTIEDANGIVVQEAMAVGLPSICLDWGGPQLLVQDGISGFLVAAESHEQITTDMAERMDRLGEDGPLAEAMSIAGRQSAQRWAWSNVAKEWLAAYPDVREPYAPSQALASRQAP